MDETDKLPNQTTQENAMNVQQDALKAQEMRQLALEILDESRRSLNLKPKKNPDLLGQKHLLTYERKLKKIKSLN